MIKTLRNTWLKVKKPPVIHEDGDYRYPIEGQVNGPTRDALQAISELRGIDTGHAVARAAQGWAAIELKLANGAILYVQDEPDGGLFRLNFTENGET